MLKEIFKIAGQMILYIMIIVALVFIFYPENSKDKKTPAHNSELSVSKLL